MATASKDIIQRVNQYLETHQFDGLTVEIVEQAVREDHGWWYVPVRPSSQGSITYHYFGVLTEY